MGTRDKREGRGPGSRASPTKSLPAAALAILLPVVALSAARGLGASVAPRGRDAVEAAGGG